MRKTKGISLIVLVITIIVMIILAGAIILSLNNSGIIGNSSSAVENYNLSEVKQMANAAWAEAYLELKEQGQVTVVGLDKKVKEKLNAQIIDLETKYIVTSTLSGVEVKINSIPNHWKENVADMVDGVPIPKGFVASPYGADEANGIAAENTKAGGLVIYELTAEEIANGVTTLPKTETQYVSWTTRNQYVWVPISKENFKTKFVRQNFGLDYVISNELGTDYWEVVLDTTTNMPLPTQSSAYVTNTTLTEVQAMYASVKEYEGFYIARYEAGLNDKRNEKGNAADLPGIKEGTKVYSAMSKIPYTIIPWTWNNSISEDTNGAVEVARRIYPNDSTNMTGVVSTLTYGVQWDATLQWYLDTKAVASVTDSISYGNYKNKVIGAGDLNRGAQFALYETNEGGFSPFENVEYDENGSSISTKNSGTTWLLSTGALKAAKVNNIYDMAGNSSEWTMEGNSSEYRNIRGGIFVYGAAVYHISRRGIMEPYNEHEYNVGFRPSLYIKNSIENN